MAKNTQLYFVAILPEEPIYSMVGKLKNDVWEKFRSKAALRSPPHVTIHMPFKFREDFEERIFDTLREVASSREPFDVSLNNFNCFEPRVIFVDVINSDSLIGLHHETRKQMRSRLKLENSNYKGAPFTPHMTIAFRDLKKSSFYEGWDYFSNLDFGGKWNCKSLTLLKHNGKEWRVYQNFLFGK